MRTGIVYVTSRLGTIALAGLLLLMAAAPARAVDFAVNTTVDGADSNPGNGQCRAGGNRCTLRAAIQEANARAGADSITLPAGTYAITIAPAGTNDAATGDFNVTDPLTINGAGASATILDGGQPPSGSPPTRRGLDRLLDISNTAGNVTLSGIAVREGWSAQIGGAIHNASQGTLRLQNVSVLNSYAATYGGGIHNAGSGRVELVNATVSGNGAVEGGSAINNDAAGTVAVLSGSMVLNNPGTYPAGGGAIHNRGADSAPGTIAVTGSTVAGNTAIRDGAGIANADDGSVVLTGATVTGNTTTADGGGIANHSGLVTIAGGSSVSDNGAANGGGVFSAGVLGASGLRAAIEVAGSSVSGNSASAAGGGIHAELETELELTGATVAANTAGGDGGGVSVAGKAGATVSGGTIAGNSAGGAGGGLRTDTERPVAVSGAAVSGNLAGTGGGGVATAGSGPVDLTATTVTDNTAEQDGGGVLTESGGTVTVERATVTGNGAGNGGGLASQADGPLRVSASTFRANEAALAGGGVANFGDATATIENSTLSENTGGGLFSDGNADLRVEHATIFRNAGGGVVHAAGQAPERLMLRGTIVAESSGGQNCSGLVGSEGGNLDSGDSCLFRATRDRRNTAAGLDAIADNGGPTLTHALRADSLAVDGALAGCPATDQRGVARPQHAGCDIGAYEFDGTPLPPDTVAPETELTEAPAASDGTALFRFTGSDDTTAPADLLFECRHVTAEPPDNEWVACASPYLLVNVDEGPQVFEVRAIDADGNVDASPARHQWTDAPDTSAPQTAFTELPPNPSTGRTATFAFTGTDDITPAHLLEFECRIDSQDELAWLECVNPMTFEDLTAGQHRVEVRAIDEGDNVDPSPAVHTWTVLPPTDCDEAGIALGAAADTFVEEESPSENFGAEESLLVASAGPNENARALVRFELPTDVPENCALISATLRLYATSASLGRDLEAVPIAAAWSESAVTWNSQPRTSGAAITIPSGLGYREWDVTAHVEAMGSTDDHGFMVRDAAEEDIDGHDQSFTSREELELFPPALELHYESTTGPPPPPPDPPEPQPATVTCGEVLRTSTLVMNNLTNCPGEGLVIGSSNIEIDLNGHVIDGPGYVEPLPEEGLPAGIRNSGYDNVFVSNGTIQEFGYGIALNAGTKLNVVEHLTLHQNALAGTELSNADDGRNGNQIRFNTIADNGMGVSLINDSEGTLVLENTLTGNLSQAVHALDSSDNRFEANRISGILRDPAQDSDVGILLENAQDSVVVANTISDTGDATVILSTGSDRSRVEDNLLVRSGDDGVSVEDSRATAVVRNVAHLMSGAGVALAGGDEGVVFGNDVRYNPGGLSLERSSGNVVEANDARRANGTGISIGAESLGNQILANVASATNGEGISMDVEVLPGQVGNLIEANTAHSNSGDGIYVGKPGHTLRDNAAHNNGSWGIWASDEPGIVDGGGNTANGNGEPEQCFGIRCGAGTPVPPIPPDTIAPDTEIVEHPPDSTNSTSARFAFTGTDDEAPATALRFECRLDSSSEEAFADCISPTILFDLAPGEHTLEVRALDPADNTDATPASYTWTVSSAPPGPDTTPPDTRLTEQPSDPTTSTSARFGFTGSDNRTAGPDLRFQCRLDSSAEAAFEPCTSPRTYNALSLDLHSFQVRAIDAAGNVDPTPASHTWTVKNGPPDNTAPQTTIDSGPDATTTETGATFTFSSNEAGSTFACALDTSAFAACESPRLFSGLSVGAHTFRVRATDPAGNTDASPAVYTWTIEAAPPPTPVSCGQVLTANARLTNGLTCSGPGLVIGAAGITIDLDGRTLDGSGSGAGIRNPGFAGVTIKNGTVRDFDFGVQLGAGTRDNVLDTLRVELNQEAGIELAGAAEGNLVRAATAVENYEGIRLAAGTRGALLQDNQMTGNSGAGLRFAGASANRIEANRITGSSDVGVVLEGASDNVLVDNIVGGNGDGAITLEAGSNRNRIERNSLTLSGDSGISVADSQGNELLANVVHEMSDAGIGLTDASGTLVRGNDVRFNPGAIELFASAANRLESNIASESAGTGISLEGLSIDNVLVLNTANGNDSRGIYMGVEVPATDGNVLDRNTTNGNSGGGIFADKGVHRIVGNTANDNNGWGIYAGEDNIDGGGNRARGNSEPQQCFGVICTS